MRLLETRDDPVPVSIQRERLLAITVGQSAAPETEPESQATPKASRVSLWESLAWRGRFFVGVLALLQIYMFVTMALVVVLSTIAFGVDLVPWIGRPLATWLARDALLDRYHPGRRQEVSGDGDG